ncbi:MAG TPA: NADH-quinone oxidoreductase subunit C [Longimicrobiales bacterium]|nr:NADH-quinone oxidoreductase subunit C [Longimicrobiales bacterium]
MSGKSFDEALSGLDVGVSAPAEADAPRGDAADATSHPSVAAMRARFGDAVLHHTVMSGDEHVVYVAAERLHDVMAFLHNDDAERYDFLLDVTAVDYGGGRPLEVVYQLWSLEHRRMLRVKATLPLTALEVASVADIWATADWLERETFDMFGIVFSGHPDLRRILMPDNYAEGYPLRKDFPLRGRFTRAEQTRRALSMAVEDFYTPQEMSVAQVVPAPGAPAAMPVDADASADAGDA